MKNRLQHIVLGLILALLVGSCFADGNGNCTWICNNVGNTTYCHPVCV